MNHIDEQIAQGMHQIIGVARTMFLTGSILSVLVGVGPMAWGQVKVRWVVTALASAMMFGVVGLVISLFDPLDDAGATTEIDWGKTGLVVLAIVMVLAVAAAGAVAADTIRSRRAARHEEEDRARAAMDPIAVSRSEAPDLTDGVSLAMSRIERLRMLKLDPDNQEDADALTMIDRRLPSIMGRYLEASAISTDDERRELARIALTTVVEIGGMAEDARRRISHRLRSDLDTEARYVAMRSGSKDIGME